MPLRLHGSGPERKSSGKGSFVVFSVAEVAQVANYFVQRRFCCCKMLIWCYCVRWKVEVPAVLLPGKKDEGNRAMAEMHNTCLSLTHELLLLYTVCSVTVSSAS